MGHDAARPLSRGVRLLRKRGEDFESTHGESLRVAGSPFIERERFTYGYCEEQGSLQEEDSVASA